MRRHLLPCILILALSVGTVVVAAELLLRDGRTIAGTDLRRDRGNYVITLPVGNAIVIPAELVEEVRLAGTGQPATIAPGHLAGTPPPDGPSGLRPAQPETLAGRPVRPPGTAEQLAVLGAPARFAEDVIDPTWVPRSGFDPDEDVLARSRSTWRRSIVDPTWAPESAFDADEDVLAPGRATWQKGIVDSTWTPTDGFAR